MEINFPNLINATLPDRHNNKQLQNRNAIILSQNDNNNNNNHNEQGFLSRDFPRSPHKLYIAAEAETSSSFDAVTLERWREEGFDVEYLFLTDGDDDTGRQKLGMLGKRGEGGSGLGPCETYGIIAFGEAAAVCLEYFHVMGNNPEFKLSVLVAYYPTRIPDPRGKFPLGVEVLVHLGKERGEEEVGVDVVSHSQLVGIQGKRRVSRRRLPAKKKNLGTGGKLMMAEEGFAYSCYLYDAPPGFAEHDLEDEFDRVADDLAFTRSLMVVRRGFRMVVGEREEDVVEGYVDGKFNTHSLPQIMNSYTTTSPPHVTYLPTLTGGIGTEELSQFYADYFLSSNPPSSTKLVLLSRTIGTNRVVDELYLSFKHTQPMPWILPGISPTNKRVEIAIVSIVSLRGGKIQHEHVYWDQASVLLQVGLLPNDDKDKKLPVVGRSAARRLLRGFDGEDGEADNELIPGWYDDDDDEDEVGNGNGNGVKEKAKGKEKGKGKETTSQETDGHPDTNAEPKVDPEDGQRQIGEKSGESESGNLAQGEAREDE
ncbi:dienelactone hydrolase [Poronia punctata]|nr:dienelactone hydrolase [Poronia punctata]